MQLRPWSIAPACLLLTLALGVRAEAPPAAHAAKKPAAAQAGKAAKSAAKPADGALSPADEQHRALALATFNGGTLTIGDLEDAITRQSPMMRARYKDAANLKDLYDKTLRFKLLAAEAERRGYGNNLQVEQAVKQNMVQALMRADFDDRASEDAISKDEVAQYCKDHIDEYVQPAMQRASQIVVATQKEAKDLLAEANDADLRVFRQMARDKSIDKATKDRGGDLRYFDRSGKPRDQPDAQVPAAVAKAVFALKNVGDTAPAPIKVDGGYAIVKLTGERPAISRKLDEVDDNIRARLWRERRQQAIEDLVKKLHEDLKPEVHAELLDKIKLDVGEETAAFPH